MLQFMINKIGHYESLRVGFREKGRTWVALHSIEGMADNISSGLNCKEGCDVSKYLPIGMIENTMPYVRNWGNELTSGER